MLTETMAKRELTVIISSHNLQEIREVCSHAAIVKDGKIPVSGEIDEIKPEEYFQKEAEVMEYDFSGLG
jgi:ABC-2 type transport system ATP-binding protein